MEANAKENADLAEEINIGQKAPARTSSESFSEESCEGHKSRRTRHCTRSRNCLNRSKNSSKEDSTVWMSDTDSDWKARGSGFVDRLNLSEFISNLSTQGGLQ